MTRSEPPPPRPAMLSELHARMAGREEELILLQATLNTVSATREPRMVTVVGPPGMGKSRLLVELVAQCATRRESGLRVFRGRASSPTQSYGLFARLLRARFGLSEGMDQDLATARVRAQVLEVLEDRRVGDVCFFLGQMMGLGFADSPVTKAVASDAARADSLRQAVVKSFFEADAASGLLVLVFENLEDADQESIELGGYLLDHLAAPLVLLFTARPEFLARYPGWPERGGARHRLLELGPLGQLQAEFVMRELLRPCEGGCPEELVRAATAAASGNPGLLEQMVRLYHDAGVLRVATESGPQSLWQVDLARLGEVSLPLTVEDTVAARLAALPVRQRRVLEQAALMGTVFWLGGLLALERQDRPVPQVWNLKEQPELEELEAVLDCLVKKDHLLRLPDSSLLGETEYVFKHRLEREQLAAEVSPTLAARYHRTIAEWLAQKPGFGSQEDQWVMLAEHLDRAREPLRAAQAWLEAARLAEQQMASARADRYYARGLELLGEAHAGLRLEALGRRGGVLELLGRHEEALGCYREMLGLAYRLDRVANGAVAHHRMGRLYRDTGLLVEAEPQLLAALELFRAAGDLAGVALAEDDLGRLHWIRGDYAQALERMRRALEIRKSLGDRSTIALSLSHIGRVLLDQGRLEPAREVLEGALALRREIGDQLGTVESLADLGRLGQEQNDHRRALSLFREAYGILAEAGERSRMAVILCAMGEAHHRLGDWEQALRVLEQAEQLSRELRDKLQLGEVKRLQAEVLLRRSELRPAREAAKQAVELFGQSKSKPHLGRALRTLGEVARAGGWGKEHQGKALEYFAHSIALFQEIGNELELARTYQAFADFVLGSEQYRDQPELQREAHKFAALAHEILERRRRVLGS